MREIHRIPLSEEVLKFLFDERTLVVKLAGDGLAGDAQHKAWYDKARSLWELKSNKAFVEIREALERMAVYPKRCMYCEGETSSQIEHLWPRAHYPWLAFVWENLLWSCDICNGEPRKADKFPLAGGNPLLIDPTSEDPLLHLNLSQNGQYSPRSGSPKGEATIDVLGLNKREELVSGRWAAWRSVQHWVIEYARRALADRCQDALEAQRMVCGSPHGSALAHLVAIIDGPLGGDSEALRLLHVELEFVAAVRAHPEIRDWMMA